MNLDPHLSDDEMTSWIDGELNELRAAAAMVHLVHCWACRARRAELEQSITDVMRIHKAAFEGRIPPSNGPAALLRAQLAELNAEPAANGRWGGAWAFASKPALAAAVLLSTALIFGWFSAQHVSAAGPLPDARLTPGATHLISPRQVCALSAQDEGRRIPADLAMRVFQQYRIANPKPRTYEVDYLISPSLGGADDIRNLWPQPYNEGVWTSRVKDALEDHLRQMVCDGRMDLASAQSEIAANWIAAYKKYFRTNRPIAAHALFVKDSPWE